MKHKVLGILILFGLFAFAAKAQTIVPWSVSQTTSKHYINIDGISATIDGSPQKFAIGAFCDSLGISICVGYGVWPEDTGFVVYGNDKSTKFHYNKGEPFQFKIWNVESSCEVSTFDIFYNAPGDSTFISGDTSKIDSIRAFSMSVSYPSKNYCISNQSISPIVKGGNSSVGYLSSPGLSIDSATGVIDLASSLWGKYTIWFLSKKCLVADSFDIEINNPPVIDLGKDTIICGEQYTLDASDGFTKYTWNTKETSSSITINTTGKYSVTVSNIQGCQNSDTIEVFISNINADFIKYSITAGNCHEGGEFRVDTFSFVTVNGWPYNHILYNLKSQSSNNTFNGEKIIKDIPTGLYSLYVKDTLGCEKLAVNSILIDDKCKPSLLLFDNSGTTEGYFIPQEGTAKIYDRFGMLQRTLEVPNIWDGTNDKGEQVPMGDYLIISNDTDKIRITVIK